MGRIADALKRAEQERIQARLDIGQERSGVSALLTEPCTQSVADATESPAADPSRGEPRKVVAGLSESLVPLFRAILVGDRTVSRTSHPFAQSKSRS